MKIQPTKRTSIENVVNAFKVLTQFELDHLLKLAKIQELNTGSAFVHLNKISKNSAFVLNGILKLVWLDQDGTEKTTEFFEPGDFVANCESYNKMEPSKYGTVALMDTELLMFKNDDLSRLAQSNINYMKLGTILTQKSVYKKEEHTRIISLKKPIDRYRYIVENKPELLQKISLTELSKYIYLTRETVSRCRLGYLNSVRLKCD